MMSSVCWQFFRPSQVALCVMHQLCQCNNSIADMVMISWNIRISHSFLCADGHKLLIWRVIVYRYYIKHEAQTEALLPDSMLEDMVRESQLHFLQLNCIELATQLTLRDLQRFRDIQQSEYIIDLFKLHSAGKPCQTTHLDAFTEVSLVFTKHTHC